MSMEWRFTPHHSIQEEIDLAYLAEYEDFLRRERLFEKRERQMSRQDAKNFLRAFLAMLFCGGIFWGVVIWRVFR